MKISKGKIFAPHLLLVFGTDGIGKSSFAASAPSPIFIGAESGTNNLDTSRFSDIKTYKDVLGALDYLQKNDNEYKTVVIDSVDWVEPLLYAHMLEKFKVNVIEDCGGGFGKWVNLMISEWVVFIEKLSLLRDSKKMNIIMIGHSHIKVFNDPNSIEPYERYVLKLQDKASAKLREYVDCVLFLNFETFVKKEKNMSKAKAFSDNERYIFTSKTAAYDAKNRFGLPDKIKLTTFNDFEMVLKGSNTNDIELVKSEINGLILDVTDKTILPKITEAVEKAGNNFAQLCAIKERLLQIT